MSSVSTIARPSVGAAAEKIGAIFLRDARLAVSYPMSFWLGWVSIAGQVLAFYFMSKLIGPSRSFGFGGRPGSYFDYVIVNLAFVEFQTVAISSFQRAIRSERHAAV